jgi:predicted nucleotidyltransferase
MTQDFVELLVKETSISFHDFGVHGSVALGMHTDKSDIDIVVYGSQNFRRLESGINGLVDGETLSYLFNNRLDAARRFKGKYQNRIFMYNAIRKPEEIRSKCGAFRYASVLPVKFHCTVDDDSEAMFRPAIYEISMYKALDSASELPKDKVPKCVVSMIGCYRNVARKDGKIRVSGMLEHVENTETGEVHHQVVVGTGTNEDEHVWPL